MIGVICAMAIEAQSFIERLTDCREEKILNISFWEGKLEEKSVVVTVSGVGKVSAGIATALMIEHYRPSLIINSGIAGGFDLNTRLLDVVLGEQIAYYDFDISFDGAFLFGQVPDAPLWFSGDEKALAIASKVQLPKPDSQRPNNYRGLFPNRSQSSRKCPCQIASGNGSGHRYGIRSYRSGSLSVSDSLPDYPEYFRYLGSGRPSRTLL